jgi:hypothetical protein
MTAGEIIRRLADMGVRVEITPTGRRCRRYVAGVSHVCPIPPSNSTTTPKESDRV